MKTLKLSSMAVVLLLVLSVFQPLRTVLDNAGNQHKTGLTFQDANQNLDQNFEMTENRIVAYWDEGIRLKLTALISDGYYPEVDAVARSDLYPQVQKKFFRS